MLSLLEVQALLDRISYKPNWKFRYYTPRLAFNDLLLDNAGTIRMIVTVEDTYNPGKTIDVNFDVPLYELHLDNETNLLRYLLNRVFAAEAHEAREWFKVDSQLYDDPHANGNRAF
jgi:hypothetical protein